jgi:putative phosphoesterase
MKIGVLSDTHDNLDNLLTVLEILRQRGIETVIHCGDLTDFTMISHFSGFRLIYLIGNMDVATGTIRKRVEQMREDNFAGLVYQGKLDGRMVAATHSHLEGKVMELVQEKRFDWIFHGHTHEKRDETVRETRIVNPGALGGLVRGPRSFCIVDLTAGEVEFIELKSSRR